MESEKGFATGKRLGHLLCVVLAWSLAIASAGGQSAPLPLFYSPAATSPNDLPAAEPVYENVWIGQFPFNSRSTASQRVRADAALTGPADAPAPTLSALRKDGTTQPFPAEGIPLAALDTLIVRVTAQLPRPGDYTLRLRLLTGDGAELTTVSRKLVRAADVFPASGIAEVTVPARMVESGSFTLRVPLSGLADRPIGFTTTDPMVMRVDTGGGETLTELVPTISNDCDSKARGTAVQLDRHESCALQVALSGVPPGAYRLRLKLQGVEGAPQPLDLPFKARASHWYMLFWLLVGALGGAFVAWWRDGQRDRATAALAIARLQEDVAQSRLALPEARPYSAKIDASLAQLRVTLAGGGALPEIEEQRANLAAQVALLSRIVQAWIVAVGHPGYGVLKAARDEALAAIGGDATAATKAADSFAAAVIAFVQGVNAAAAARESAESAVSTAPIDLSWLGQAVGVRDGVPEILRKQRRLDIVATIVLVLFFGLFTLMTVWSPDADWGNFTDRGTAVFIGAAAFGGIAGTLGSFRTTISGLVTP